MQKNNPAPYQFSKQLDVGFLNELFEGDTEYAATVFADFLKHMPLYWQEVADAYKNNNLTALKSAVHKCKTLFGYVGHTHVLEIFQSFEAKCGEITEVKELASSFGVLVDKKDHAYIAVEKEYQRLKQYLQSSRS